jgi:hypothetical protein
LASKAEKLLERMRRSKSGWKRKDFDTLYEGFGFTIRSGSSHDIVSHPDFPELRDTLPRHSGELGKSYAKDAVKLVDELLRLQEGQAQEENSDE